MDDVRSAPAPTSRRIVAAASIGSLVEGYDLALYGYLAVILADRFFPAEEPDAALLATFAVFALGFAARPLGGLFFGHIGDRAGRRPAVAAAVLLMAVATTAIAVIPTYQQVGILASVLLLACRVLQGFSIGGEIAGSNVFVLEHAGTGRGGRAVSVNMAASSLGVGFAAAAGWLLTATLDASDVAAWGWRLPFAVAAPLGLIGVYLRWRVPETPAFDTPARPRFPLARVVRSEWRGVLLFVGFAAMVLAGGYLLIGYLPSYLVRTAGLSAGETSVVNLAAAAALGGGAVLGGQLFDRVSPRAAAAACAAGMMVTVVPSFLAVRQGTLAAAVVGVTLWGVIVGVGNAVGPSLAIHLFAAPIRYTATAFALNLAAVLFAGTGPYLSAWLVRGTGTVTAPGWYLAALAAGGLAVALLGLPGRTRVTRNLASGPGLSSAPR
jgi:MHS family proline/betaine transporter-like MFS transporter